MPPPPLVEANFVGVEEEGQERVPVTWETVDWLRSITTLPLLIKGILTAEDALLALEHGVSGIVVSNHGGRQLDGALTSIEALPEIAEAVAGRCEVYMDGGIRRGTDILKALALGAHAVLVGRPVLWGLAVDGANGVQQVLEILHAELERAMKLASSPSFPASIAHWCNGREIQLTACAREGICSEESGLALRRTSYVYHAKSFWRMTWTKQPY